MPISAMKPIVAVKEMRIAGEREHAAMPPAMPNGTTVSTISVLLKLPNSSTRIATMPSSATMSADCRPPKLSVRVLELAARHVRVAARPFHLVEPLAARPAVTRSVL